MILGDETSMVIGEVVTFGVDIRFGDDVFGGASTNFGHATAFALNLFGYSFDVHSSHRWRLCEGCARVISILLPPIIGGLSRCRIGVTLCAVAITVNGFAAATHETGSGEEHLPFDFSGSFWV
jgi:hypothetical protein